MTDDFVVAHGASAHLMTPTDDIVLEREQARLANDGEPRSA